MKIQYKNDVYQDTLTGMLYSREYAFRPTPLINGEGTATVFGVLLKPYGGNPNLGEEESAENDDALSEQVGYPIGCLGQSIFVTDEQLTSRFKHFGELRNEKDLDKLTAEYEGENCDFANRQFVIRRAEHYLAQEPHGLTACILYALLKDYKANTPELP